MTCRELINSIELHLAGELSSIEHRLFEEHLAICRACRDYLDSYRRAIVRGKRALAAEQEEPAVPEDLVRAILAARKRRS